jgi:hypothetical protein
VQSVKLGPSSTLKGLALAWFIGGLGAPACSDTPAPTKPQCTQNSDCQAPNVCALGSCRAKCKSSDDCSEGQWCLVDTEAGAAACVDKNKPCNKTDDCHAPLACASDYRCRNLCSTDTECNILGLKGRFCAKDDNGYQFCADPEDTSGGRITALPPAEADTSKGVEPPGPDMVSSGGMGGAPDMSLPGNGGSPEPHTGGSTVGGNTSAGSAGVSGNGPENGGSTSGGDGAGGESGAAPVECVPGCIQGKTCVGGACASCGAANQACCDGTRCGANLQCNGSLTCSCGRANEPCCGGTSCSGGLSCDASAQNAPVCACGTLGTRCCPGTSGGEATCSVGACAGTKCSCIAGLALATSGGGTSVVALRTDGTIWQYNSSEAAAFSELKGYDSKPLVASDIAVSKITGSGYHHIGCGVVGGSVWCFPDATLADATFLGGGLGPTDTTSSPVQVLTAVGGTALTGIQQISANPIDRHTFCAVASDGAIWCWGYGATGQLGRGDTANSSFARKVLANASAPFANAVEVRVGFEVTCARKIDGSVWCWGSNNDGELGYVGASSYYPVKIAFSGTAGQITSKRLNAGPDDTFCSLMQDSSVVCWGYNQFGEAGAPPAVGSIVGPTTVVVAADSAPLTNIIDLASGPGYPSGRTCARTADLDIVCWGAGSPYPVAFKDASNNAVSGIRRPLSGSYDSIGYVAPDGRLFASGAPLTVQPPCMDLLQ